MINKNPRIIDVITLLQNKYGEANIIINDHWEADLEAIGLADKTKQYSAYISTANKQNGNYYLFLENPPINDTLPYSPAGEFANLTFDELEKKLTIHLRLTN